MSDIEIDDDNELEPYVSIKVRREQKLRAKLDACSQQVQQKRPRGFVIEATDETTKGKKKKTLLDERAETLAKGGTVAPSKAEEAAREEHTILESIDQGFKPLMSVQELATGVTYTKSMTTGWRPPSHIRDMSEEERQAIRDKWHILVEGEDIPPPIKSFRDMR